MTGHFVRLVVGSLVLAALAACGGGGGGDGGTTSPQVSSVVITSPNVGPAFATLGRTAQFTAEARSSSGSVITGVSITWASSDNAVATVSSSGLVTAAGNGAAQIRASASGVQSSPVTVTVAQLAASVTITPSSVTFGAIGSARQLAAAVKDSGSSAISGATVTWTRAGPGTVASVSASGLVTSVANGTGDSAVATSGTIVAKAPITVSQVTASVTVSSTGSDTLFKTTTKQYSAVARDSNSNVISGATFTWSSSQTAVATVNSSTGLAAAVSDGSTNIIATSGSTTGQKGLVVRRYAATFSISPTSASITTNAGTQAFNGTAQDSTGVNLTITWTSRNTGVITISPGTGTSTTATAVGNGSTFLIIFGGTRSDSAGVTASNQVTTAPTTAAVDVRDDFFQSVRNMSNPAVDTVAVGGTVTWTWRGSTSHNVTSGDSPAKFTASATQLTGTFSVTFQTSGTYHYFCTIHGTPTTGMIGSVVVR